MDLLTKEGAKLAPKDTPEGVAIFRAQVIGPLLTRAFSSHGELADAIRMLARHKHLPPGASATRFYSEATIERWYYRFKKRGLAGLTPKRRSDVGHARELTDAQRDLLCAVRREHPSTSTALILRTLELDGRLAKGAVSLSTINRLFRSQGLDKVTLRVADGRVRLRWQADRVDALWHADVCHGPAMKIGGTHGASAHPRDPRRPQPLHRCDRRDHDRARGRDAVSARQGDARYRSSSRGALSRQWLDLHG